MLVESALCLNIKSAKPLCSGELRLSDTLKETGKQDIDIVKLYEFEKAAAERLKNSSKEERKHLYREIYSELLFEFPSLRDIAVLENTIRLQYMLLEPYLSKDMTILEIGSGNMGLIKLLAVKVRSIITIEATKPEISEISEFSNLRIVESGMPPYDLKDGSVDLVFTSHFIEHLHPEDARAHFAEMKRLLRKGGVYICITPNRLYGPHDVSRRFQNSVACGLHLKEYTYSDVRGLFRDYGFGNIRRLRIAAESNRMDTLTIILFEKILLVLPFGIKTIALKAIARLMGRKRPFRFLEQVICAGEA